MTASRDQRNQFFSLVIVLAIISVACVIYLLLPKNRAASAAKREQVKAAQQDLRTLETQVLPLRGLDQKLAHAKTDIADFYQTRLPDRYSSISDTINTLAAQNHVRLTNVTYTSEASDINDLQQVTMRASLSGEYGDVMRYIDALDHSKVFLLIDDVGLQNSQKEGNIQLTLTLETYLRGAASAPSNAAGAL